MVVRPTTEYWVGANLIILVAIETNEERSGGESETLTGILPGHWRMEVCNYKQSLMQQFDLVEEYPKKQEFNWELIK